MRSLYLVFCCLGLFTAGFTMVSRNKCGPCTKYPVRLPYMNFSVVDKATGTGLFFGNGAVYNTTALVM